VIHGNYLAADEIAYLAAQRERLSVVYCPRTHDYFGHDAYPLAPMLQADVRVAVGTDSRATNPDLNLFAELRHLSQQHPDVSPATILRMGTLSGAEALGIAFEYGSIKPGKRAELLVVPLSTTSGPVEEAILQADLSTRPQRLADFTAD
jgi:cytosine/adenosine deaminase-related metal-dependent hydrolase